MTAYILDTWANDLDSFGLYVLMTADDPPKLKQHELSDGVVIIDARWVDDDDQRNDAEIAVWRPVDEH